MSKYVEVSALEKAIIEYAQDLRTLSTKTVGQAISSLPTIDIVHCAECKYWNKADHICKVSKRYKPETMADHFCSYGERKEE